MTKILLLYLATVLLVLSSTFMIAFPAAAYTSSNVSSLHLTSTTTTTKLNDARVVPTSMDAGVCREVNCGPVGPPPNPCQNIPGTIFWPSSGQCVPSYCPPGGNAEIRGARLNSGLCDPVFSREREEEHQEERGDEEQQEKEVASDEDTPSLEEEITPYLMGGILKKGPLGIPETVNRPVVKPGIPGQVPLQPPINELPVTRPPPTPIGAGGAAALGEVAVVAIAAASLFLAGMTISAAYYGEDTPLEVADQYYGTHFADIYGWISGDY